MMLDPTHTGLVAAFVSPALAVAGGVAAAAPVLIHLLARRRFRRIRWAAIDFLLTAERQNRRRLHMEDWALMCLRAMALLLIGMFLARPFVQPDSMGGALTGTTRTERVIVLDDSLSMQCGATSGTVFDRARQATARLIETIRSEAPNDTLTLFRSSQPGQPIESGLFLDPQQVRRLLDRVTALSPTQRRMNPQVVLSGVATWLNDNPGIPAAAVYVLSDFQRNEWATVGQPGSAQAGALADPLATWAGASRGLRVVLVNLADGKAGNGALTELTLESGPKVAGTSAQVTCRCSNFRASPMVHATLTPSLGNFTQPGRTVPLLEAWQSTAVDLQLDLLRPGPDVLRVDLPPDELPLDNTRFAVVNVTTALRVLVVNGEPATGGFDDEVLFLTTALRPEGEVFSGCDVTTVDEAGLEDQDLAQYHTVVLANVYQLGDRAIQRLSAMVRSGAGLVIFLGDQVDTDAYNLNLLADGEGLLPVALTERRRSNQASRLLISDPQHPVLRGLAQDGDPLGLSRVGFFRYVGCSIAQPKVEDPAAANAPMRRPQVTATSVRVLARFDDEEGSPAIVEGRFGQGRVMLVTTSCDKEWNDWPDHPTYLPVVMELIQHAAAGGQAEQPHLVGQPLHVRIDPARFLPDALVRGPAYPDEPELAISAAVAADGMGMTLTWPHTETAGVYRFVLRGRDGTESINMAAVNIDPLESDLSTCTRDTLAPAMVNVPFEYIEGLEALGTASREARTELWKAILLVAMGVLILEHVLAWQWGRRQVVTPRRL